MKRIFYFIPLLAIYSGAASSAQVDWASVLKTKSCSNVMKSSSASGLSSKFETRFEGCAFFFEHPSSRFALRKNLLTLDTCNSKESSWLHHGLGATADAAQRIETSNSKEREKIKTMFLSLRSRATEVCCHGDRECAEGIQKTELNWCDVPVDEKSRAPCREGGVFTNQTGESWKLWQKERKKLEDVEKQGFLSGKSANAAKNKITLPIFEVFLSQRVRSPSRAPLSDARVIGHELGHVCVNTKRFQEIRSGDLEKSRASFSLSNDLGWPRTPDGLSPRCTPTAKHEKAWRALAASLRLNNASIECLNNLAAHASEPRFKISKGQNQVCKPVCKNDIWDEALADAIHFEILPAQDWFPHLFPGYCTYRRDGSHALTADQLSCYLLTPSFKKKIESGIGCRR